MQKARAKKHSEKVKAEQAMLEVDDEVEKALEEIYEDFLKARGLLGEDNCAKNRHKAHENVYTKPKGNDSRSGNTR